MPAPPTPRFHIDAVREDVLAVRPLANSRWLAGTGTGSKQRLGEMRRQTDDSPGRLCQTDGGAAVIDDDDVGKSQSGNKQSQHDDQAG